MDMNHKRICKNCGLTYGAHRTSNTINQCPSHQGRMDWSETDITTFVDSGEVGEVEYGRPSLRLSLKELAEVLPEKEISIKKERYRYLRVEDQ